MPAPYRRTVCRCFPGEADTPPSGHLRMRQTCCRQHSVNTRGSGHPKIVSERLAQASIGIALGVHSQVMPGMPEWPQR
jgi:hypothetical protein